MPLTKIVVLTLFIALMAMCASANQSARGWCEDGAQPVVTSGLSSLTFVQLSAPQCTVTVYLHGTTTIATIYSDNNMTPTPLANPFTATTSGQWAFYAANGHYDVLLSGGTSPNAMPATVTYSDLILFDCTVSGACGGATTIDIDGNPIVDPNFVDSSSYYWSVSGSTVQLFPQYTEVGPVGMVNGNFVAPFFYPTCLPGCTPPNPPQGWSLSTGTTMAYDMTTAPANNEFSVKLTCITSSAECVMNSTVLQTIIPGQTYTATAYIRGDGTIGTQLAWEFERSADPSGDLGCFSTPVTSTTWTFVTLSCTAGSQDNAFIYITQNNDGASTAGNMWVQDVQVYANNVAGPLAITGSASVGGTFNVTGNVTLSGALAVTGNATVGGTLGVTGAETVTGALNANGALNAAGALNATGNVTATAGQNDLTAYSVSNVVVMDGNRYPFTNAGIQAAVNATPSGGMLVLPPATYMLTGTGTEEILITQPINFACAGWGTILQVGNAVPNTTDVIHIKIPASTTIEGLQVHDCYITEASQNGTSGRYGISIDTQSLNTNSLAHSVFRHNFVGYLGGSYSIDVINPPTSGNGSIYLTTFEDNFLANGGIGINGGGDSNNVLGNQMTYFTPSAEPSPGVSLTSVGGAATNVIMFNNMTTLGGCVVVHAAIQPKIMFNQCEIVGGTTTEPNSAMIDIAGDVSGVDSGYIVGNNLNAQGNANQNIRVTNALYIRIENNTLDVTATSSGIGILNNGNLAIGTIIGPNEIATLSGGAVAFSGTGSSSFSTTGNKSGTATCSSSTATVTFGTAYLVVPIITVSDETTAGGVRITTKTASGFVVACTGASDVFDWTSAGNPL